LERKNSSICKQGRRHDGCGKTEADKPLTERNAKKRGGADKPLTEHKSKKHQNPINPNRSTLMNSGARQSTPQWKKMC
jgi:hypothetical protein